MCFDAPRGDGVQASGRLWPLFETQATPSAAFELHVFARAKDVYSTFRYLSRAVTRVKKRCALFFCLVPSVLQDASSVLSTRPLYGFIRAACCV